MVEIRLAKNGEVGQLKELWKVCFGDEEDYINLYFNYKYKQEETAVLLWAGKIVAMATMIPAHMVMENGERYDLAMLYAIATHPEFQGKGLSTQIMEFCHGYLESHHQDLSILVPAQESLFGFYAKRGYKDGFYIREVTLTQNEIIGFKGNRNKKCFIKAISASEYNTRRRKALKGRIYIDYSNEAIAYQKRLCQEYGGDLYALDMEGAIGCAILEKINGGKILIKEMLMPDHLIEEAIRQIAKLLDSQEYVLRLPGYLGAHLGGAIRHFGMIKGFTQKDMVGPEELAYLGIAYD